MLHANNSESPKTILGLIPEPDRLDAVKVKNNEDKAVLDYAAGNPESLKVIHEFIPAPGSLNAVKNEKSLSINNNRFLQTQIHKNLLLNQAKLNRWT